MRPRRRKSVRICFIRRTSLTSSSEQAPDPSSPLLSVHWWIGWRINSLIYPSFIHSFNLKLRTKRTKFFELAIIHHDSLVLPFPRMSPNTLDPLSSFTLSLTFAFCSINHPRPRASLTILLICKMWSEHEVLLPMRRRLHDRENEIFRLIIMSF